MCSFAAHVKAFVRQRHAKRLARSGQIKEIAGAFLRPRRELTFEESMQTYEVGACVLCECTLHDCLQELPGVTCCGHQVLAEILQQGARIDDPDAAARQEFVRCVGMVQPWGFVLCLCGQDCCCTPMLALLRCLLAWCERLPYS